MTWSISSPSTTKRTHNDQYIKIYFLADVFMFVIPGEGDEEEDTLPDDFFYDYDGIVSKPYYTEGVPDQLITLQYP